MPQLARLEFTVQDTAGNAVSGASVEIRSQGAQVAGAQAGPITTINVDSPGAVVATNTVAINLNATTRSVNSITATTVDVSGPGFSSVSDDDIITIVSPLPTVYEDAESGTSKANPLTTDANGYASCFVIGSKYDVKISGGGLTARLLQGVSAVGGETNRSNVFMSGTDTAWVLDTLRTAAAGDALLAVRNNTTNEFRVMGDGEIIAGAATATHALTGTLTTSGALTVSSGGAAITGAITGTTTIAAGTTVTGGTGVIATTGNVEASANTGYIRGARTRFDKGTALTTAEWAIDANWGTTATKFVAGSFGTDQAGQFNVTANGAGLASPATCTLTFKDGAWPGGVRGVAVRGETGAPATAFWMIQAAGTTSITWSFNGLPVAGTTYALVYWHFSVT